MITVTSLANSGAGTLRQAIADAAPGETIDFAVTGTINLLTQITISKNLIITGPGEADLIIQRNAASFVRLFLISAGVVSISDVTIRNGGGFGVPGGNISNEATLTMTDCTISFGGVAANNRPGGNFYNTSSLTLIRCTVTNGEVHFQDGNPLNGGGVYNTGTLVVTDSLFQLNNAYGSGGAIYNSGTVNFNGRIVQNYAGGFTPIVLNDGGTLTLTDTSILESGGIGVQCELGTVNIIRCTIANGQSSGVVVNSGGTLNILNSTISSNGSYCGLINNGGALDIRHCTITKNNVDGEITENLDNGGIFNTAGGALTLYNTILAGASLGYDLVNEADVFSEGHNIFGTYTGALTPGTNDLFGYTFGTVLLGELADYGGTTLTHQLLPGSPALDSGDNTDAPATDQRGEVRVVNSTIDIGAYESPLAAPPITLTVCVPAGTFCAQLTNATSSAIAEAKAQLNAQALALATAQAEEQIVCP